ncbi:hypothetical protein LTEGF4_24930 [Limnohabitans sp. TEGF004]|nr:hypothetical protein LTEGF4_24930 [Limnohabitans sp. TEGF004]
MTAAANIPTTNQRNSDSSTAARRPTPAMSHTHIKDASSPIVNARSTTCGTHSIEATNHASNTPHIATSETVQRGFASGSSTTANKAHAAIIQLTNKGMTAVDGLLTKGLSHGKATHNTKMTLRTKRL